MQIRRLCVLTMGVLVTGCGIWGPSYEKPNIDKPNQWRSKDSLSQMESSANLPDTAWWRSFNDPKLNDLIESALKYNNNIQAAIGNIIQAEGNLQRVKMGWVPTLSLFPSYGATGGFSAGSGGGTANPVTTGGGNTGYQVGLIPNYTLNILQQLRLQEQAEAQLLAAKYTKDALRLTIISQVAGSYFTLGEQVYQLDLQKQLVVDSGRLYDLAKLQYDNGYISLLSLQVYLENYQTAKAQIPIIENNIVATQNSLRVLINQNPGRIVMGSDFIKMPMKGIIPANMPSTVLKQRPDIMQAEQNLIAANANIGVATSYFFPSLNITGGVGTATNSFTQLFNASTDWWSAQIGANMPVLNLAQYGVIKGAKGAYYTAYYQYVQTVRQAFAEVDNGLSGHQKLTDSYNQQLEAYNSSVVAYQLGVENFKNGYFNELQELNYKVNMENLAISLANSKLNQLQSIVNLYQALAGGYNVNNESNSVPIKFGDAHDA